MNETTCTYSGVTFDVSYEFEEENKGGIEEEPSPEYFEILHAKYQGAEFIEMLHDDVIESFKEEIRNKI